VTPTLEASPPVVRIRVNAIGVLPVRLRTGAKLLQRQVLPNKFHAFKRKPPEAGTLTLNRDSKHLTTEYGCHPVKS
jgi:hypothetical protein